MSRHATALRDALTTAAGAVQSDAQISRAARDHAADVMLDPDILASMQASLRLILALEAQAQAAEMHAGRMRAALLNALESTTGRVAAGIHTASVVNGRAAVAITDDAAIPPGFLEQPPPRPDKAAILKALKAGGTVPGVVLRNGAPSLRITVNDKDAKDTAA